MMRTNLAGAKTLAISPFLPRRCILVVTDGESRSGSRDVLSGALPARRPIGCISPLARPRAGESAPAFLLVAAGGGGKASSRPFSRRRPPREAARPNACESAPVVPEEALIVLHAAGASEKKPG